MDPERMNRIKEKYERLKNEEMNRIRGLKEKYERLKNEEKYERLKNMALLLVAGAGVGLLWFISNQGEDPDEPDWLYDDDDDEDWEPDPAEADNDYSVNGDYFRDMAEDALLLGDYDEFYELRDLAAKLDGD